MGSLDVKLVQALDGIDIELRRAIRVQSVLLRNVNMPGPTASIQPAVIAPPDVPDEVKKAVGEAFQPIAGMFNAKNKTERARYNIEGLSIARDAIQHAIGALLNLDVESMDSDAPQTVRTYEPEMPPHGAPRKRRKNAEDTEEIHS